MQPIVLSTVSLIAGAGLGIILPKWLEKAVRFKNLQVSSPRKVYKQAHKNEKWHAAGLLAGLFMVAFWFFEPLRAIFLSVFSVLAVFGALMDRRIRIIPNELVILLAGGGLLYQAYFYRWQGVLSAVAAMIAVAILFGVCAAITHRISGQMGVGAGDIKLSMAIALTLGWNRLYIFLVGIAGAICVYVLGGLWKRTLYKGATFPMGGQIMAGFVLALYWPAVIKIIGMVLR